MAAVVKLPHFVAFQPRFFPCPRLMAMKRKVVIPLTKRLLALVSAVLLVLSLSLGALAEETLYTQPDGLYTVTVPEGWLVVDAANVEAILEQAGKEESFNSAIRTALQQAAGVPIAIFYAPDASVDGVMANINIAAIDLGMAVSADMLLTMAPQLDAQFKATFADWEAADEAALVDLGVRQIMGMGGTYTLLDKTMSMQQAFFTVGTTMYTVTLTATPDTLDSYAEAFAQLLGTLVVAGE